MVHKFDSIGVDAAVPRRSIALKKDAFSPTASAATMNFKDIVTTSQKAPYFSPSATNVSLPAADLVLLRDARKAGKLRHLHLAWQGFFCSYKHSLVFRIEVAGQAPSQWYLAMDHFENSACIVLPVFVESHKEYPEQQFLRPMIVKDPVLVSIFDITTVVAFKCTFRSWSWQKNTCRLPRRRLFQRSGFSSAARWSRS
jgi:hypothetical protein